MLLYIRHGDDRGHDDHRHDRQLRSRAKRKAAKVAQRLIETFGHPQVAYVSPFQRTLETLDAMSSSFEVPVIVHRDPRIAHRLRKKQQRDPDISPVTASEIPINESRDDLERRLDLHVQDMRNVGYHRSAIVVWCITHTIVIKGVAKRFDVRVPKRIDFLDQLVVR